MLGGTLDVITTEGNKRNTKKLIKMAFITIITAHLVKLLLFAGRH